MNGHLFPQWSLHEAIHIGVAAGSAVQVSAHTAAMKPSSHSIQSPQKHDTMTISFRCNSYVSKLLPPRSSSGHLWSHIDRSSLGRHT